MDSLEKKSIEGETIQSRHWFLYPGVPALTKTSMVNEGSAGPKSANVVHHMEKMKGRVP